MNRITTRYALIAAFGVGLASPAGARPVSCDLSAYLLSSDESGTNVRSAPDVRAAVVETVPRDSEAIATITGFKNGWFRVEMLEKTGGETDETLFEGRAWVHRSQLHVDVAGGSQDLRASPSGNAPIVARVAGEQADVTLLGCSGDWVQVRAGGTTGWLAPEGQCANPLTTCP